MKKFLAVGLSVLALCGVLTACGGADNDTAKQQDAAQSAEVGEKKVENTTPYDEFTANCSALEKAYIKVKEAYEDDSVSVNKDVEDALNVAADLINNTIDFTPEKYETTAIDEINAEVLKALDALDNAYKIMHPEEAETQTEAASSQTTAQ